MLKVHFGASRRSTEQPVAESHGSDADVAAHARASSSAKVALAQVVTKVQEKRVAHLRFAEGAAAARGGGGIADMAVGRGQYATPQPLLLGNQSLAGRVWQIFFLEI